MTRIEAYQKLGDIYLRPKSMISSEHLALALIVSHCPAGVNCKGAATIAKCTDCWNAEVDLNGIEN